MDKTTKQKFAWVMVILALVVASVIYRILHEKGLEQTSADWRVILSLPYWQVLLTVQIIILFMIPGLSAVQEFKERGGGTPFPWDPPQSLVTTGIYAYVTNPMQVSMVLIYPILGILLNNNWVILSGLMVVAFFYGIARWHQDKNLTKRFGDAWHLYRKNVRPWFPSWRPWIPPAKEQAVVYFDIEGCSFCRDLAAWYLNQHPSGIAVVDARKHPDRDLFRMAYRSADNKFEEEGIVALGRILGHINLAWAFIGCIMRLPVISQLIELFVDQFLVKPHWVRRKP